MEDLHMGEKGTGGGDDHFATWVNTDDDDAPAVKTNQGTSKSTSNHTFPSPQSSRQLQGEIARATWSPVFEETDTTLDRQSPGKLGHEHHSHGPGPGPDSVSASVHSNFTAVSDTTSQCERKEFFRKEAEGLSDDGGGSPSPGGLSLLSQAAAGRFAHPTPTPESSERRRSRRKHRQVARANKSPHTPHHHEEQEQDQEGRLHQSATSSNRAQHSLGHEQQDDDFCLASQSLNDENAEENTAGAGRKPSGSSGAGQGMRGGVALGMADSDSNSEPSQPITRAAIEKQFLAALGPDAGGERRGEGRIGVGVDVDAASVASSSSMANSVR